MSKVEICIVKGHHRRPRVGLGATLPAGYEADLCHRAPYESALDQRCAHHDHLGLRDVQAPRGAISVLVHLLEAAVLHSLSAGTKFGVLTTGRDVVSDIDAGVRRIMGGNSDRYVGTIPTGLGVLELAQGDKTHVHNTIKKGAAAVAARGADVIILGCAGMAGMESLVRQGVREAGLGDNAAVVDGAKAGVQIIAGLARSQYRD